MSDAPRSRPLQLLRLRRPGDGRVVRRAAVQRSDRRLIAETAGAGARRVPRAGRRAHGPRRRHRHRPRGDRARAPRRASSPASTRRRRCSRSRGAGRRSGTSTSRSCRATRTRCFPDRSFDAVVCLRVLMHTPDWRQSLGELCRVARDRVVFDYPALASAAALQAADAARRRTPLARASRRTACSAIARCTRRFARDGFRVAGSAPPVRAADRACTSGSARRPRRARIEGALARVGLRALLGSPVTVVAERCAS